MSSVWCRVCDVKCVMSSLWCRFSDVECEISMSNLLWGGGGGYGRGRVSLNCFKPLKAFIVKFDKLLPLMLSPLNPKDFNGPLIDNKTFHGLNILNGLNFRCAQLCRLNLHACVTLPVLRDWVHGLCLLPHTHSLSAIWDLTKMFNISHQERETSIPIFSRSAFLHIIRVPACPCS